MNKLNTRIVLRNDNTQGWATVKDNEDLKLLKGEIGIEFVTDNSGVPTGKIKMKIGDGVKTWSQLPYFGGDEGHVFETTVAQGADHQQAITTVVGTAILSKGDIAIIKEEVIASAKLSATVQQKYQYTAYVYDGSVWKAMDGNYSAENVYFNEDFTFTTNIGTVTGVTGSKVVSAAGKNLKQFLSGLFAQEVDGGADTSATNKGQPSGSITLRNNGTNVTSNISYEVGTEFIPSYVTSFSAGKYKYGPDPTGVTVTSYSITATDGSTTKNTSTESSGSFDSFTIGDSTSYKISASIAYSEGATPNSNLGNPKGTKIAAGTLNKSTAVVSGYRAQFGGGLKTTDRPTGTSIRENLTAFKPGATFGNTGKTGKVTSSTTGCSVKIPNGSKQIVIALYGKQLKNAFYTGALGNDIFANGTIANITTGSDNQISVSGVDNYDAKNYTVYVATMDKAISSDEWLDIVVG